MSNKNGFTLMELIVVMIIIGILAAVGIPNYNTFVLQGAGRAAQNNLVTIYNAQKQYYLDSVNGGSYYNSPTGNDQAGINAALGLNITDNYFQYTCATVVGPPTSYTCTATYAANGAFKLTLSGGTSAAPTPIILSGGTGCTASPWVAPCNPTCTSPANSNYCPN